MSPPQVMQHAFAALQRGDLAEAERLCRAVLDARADEGTALHLLGIVAAQSGRTQEAAELLSRAVSSDPTNADAQNNRGAILRVLGHPAEALQSHDRAIALRPGFPEAHNNRGVVLNDLKRHSEAMESYDRAIELKPGYAEAHYNRAATLRELGRHSQAVESYERAIELDPGYADAHYNRGIALRELGRHAESFESFERAIGIRPDFAQAHNNRGSALSALGRHAEALQSYDRAVALKPDFAEAHFNRGNANAALERHADAQESYERAIALRPDYAEAYYNLGNLLRNLKRYGDALRRYDQAISLRPVLAAAHNNRGLALRELALHAQALQSFDRAISIRPDFAEAHANRALTLRELNRHAEALESYERALRFEPDRDFLYGDWLHTRMQVCDWRDAEAHFAGLAGKLERGEKAAQPFVVLALPGSPATQRKAAEIWVRHRYPASQALPPVRPCPGHDRIRIGYFSPDFREHPVSRLTVELFEKHDKSRFELTAFSFGPDTKDKMRERVSAAFGTFVDVRDRPDIEVARLARQAEIDIAVDLAGFTRDSRPGIFAMRAAPIQASYIGYLGTMGAGYIDYLISDHVTIPESARQHYSEKIAYLPCYQVNDSRRRISDRIFTREELGLPESGFVFCCLNGNYKITPATFDSWMRILGRVAGSVLFLFADNDQARLNLKKEASRRGVDPERLVFGERLPAPEYLARYRSVDLFLDTLPYNAGTTASDALWAGLPVLTCPGETFAGRVAASLLEAIRLPELIATSMDEYEAVAIELAANRARLQDIRQKLAANRLDTPLFDTRVFAKRIEAAYEAMHERRRLDLPPDHIDVHD